MKKQIYNITNEYELQWAQHNQTFELETGIINQPFDDDIFQIGEKNGTICGTFYHYDVVLLIWVLFSLDRVFALDRKSFWLYSVNRKTNIRGNNSTLDAS